MVAGGRFVRVRFGYLSLLVPAVAVNLRKTGGNCQTVGALRRPWQQVFVPYGHCVEPYKLDTEAPLVVFIQGKHRRACPSPHCRLDHALCEDPAVS